VVAVEEGASLGHLRFLVLWVVGEQEERWGACEVVVCTHRVLRLPEDEPVGDLLLSGWIEIRTADG
jgi:hypothetical protein